MIDVFTVVEFFTTDCFTPIFMITHGWISLEIVRVITNGIDSITNANHSKAPAQPVTVLSSVHYNSGNTNLEVEESHDEI